MPTHLISENALAGLHLVVVDDDADARDILKAFLGYWGAFVNTAAGADDALRILRIVKADAVIADLCMPENDGEWLVRAIRNLPPERGGRVPVIAITAHDDRYVKVKMLAAGFDGFFVKPIVMSDLVACIQTLATGDMQAAPKRRR